MARGSKLLCGGARPVSSRRWVGSVQWFSLELWSTKYSLPVSVILLSQPCGNWAG